MIITSAADETKEPEDSSPFRGSEGAAAGASDDDDDSDCEASADE